MQTLKGRTCVMAGATAGDGRPVVKALCEAGMNVVVMTHQAPMAESLIREIEEAGYPGKCIYAAGDDAKGPAEEQAEVFESIKQQFGSVDVIICNTGGYGKQGELADLEKDQLVRDLGHLTGGSYGMLRTAYPFLKESKNPRVIFMTTVEGCFGGVHESFANAIAKSAVRGLTLNAAARLAKEGITVNAISKGPIPRVDPMRPGDCDPADMLPFIPMGRLGTPEDLAAAVCFFASEESSFITGQILAVDGGLSVSL